MLASEYTVRGGGVERRTCLFLVGRRRKSNDGEEISVFCKSEIQQRMRRSLPPSLFPPSLAPSLPPRNPTFVPSGPVTTTMTTTAAAAVSVVALYEDELCDRRIRRRQHAAFCCLFISGETIGYL